jgi:3-dehydroquinate synthase
MVDSPVSSQLPEISIKSYRGLYNVQFIDDLFSHLSEVTDTKSVFIIDKNISEIYAAELTPILKKYKFITIEANENNKDLNCFSGYINELIELEIKRDHTLIAIGGGVIQDITCFIASTLFRGMNWHFYPSTLLAQADSCIGSKSSINVAGIKNLMGTFTPPNKIFIAVKFLKTLEHKEILSGLGEMIKVHGIAGIDYLREIDRDYTKIVTDDFMMNQYIYKSLMIKKGIIEIDEFDTGPRNIMNYGHTFGHAIETASNYEIAHGIAVTIGQDMACNYSIKKKFISKPIFEVANSVLRKNFHENTTSKINFIHFLGAIKKDKKNIGSQVAIIIPVNDTFKIEKKLVDADDDFISFCRNYFITNGFTLYE